ncbi:hypothetical protein [Sinomonas sp. RB5]
MTAVEAAGLLGMSDRALRAQLRQERPSGAVQRPDQKNGRWYLSRSYVEQLAAERGVALPAWRTPGQAH